MKYADQYQPGKGRLLETMRDLLIARARNGKTILYSELGERVGRPAQGPWPELDIIADDERDAQRPDATLLVIQRNGFPQRYRKRSFNPNNAEDVAEYTEELKALFDFYRPAGRPPPRKPPELV